MSAGPSRRRDADFRLRVWLARAAGAWERLWAALWPAVAVAGLFVAVALFDVLPALSPWIHALVLAAFAVAAAVAVWRGVRGLRLPRGAEALSRMERASGLKHRPLTTLDDRLAAGRGDPVAESLWRAHKRRARNSVRRLRIGLPRPDVAGRDPWAFRAAVLLILVVAVGASWGDAGSRLHRALVPLLDAGGTVPPARLEVWITPPEYTRMAPRYLDAGKPITAPLKVPAGSEVLAQLQGGRGTPVLSLDDRETAFEALGQRSYRAKVTLEKGSQLSVSQAGRVVESWSLEVVPDGAPTVEFFRPPTRTPRATLRIDYEARDDYAVAAVRAVIRRLEDSSAGTESAESIVLDLPLPGTGPRTGGVVRGTSYHDLTAHPWAGLPVTVVLEAKDGLDQVGRSDRFTMALPERIFQHPVARAIIEQRKRLTVAPEERRDVARELRALASRPKHFFDDKVVYLALRTAQWRLIFDSGADVIGAVQALLWDTALRIEDGGVSLSERQLREAEEALREALSREADSAELEQLLDQLQKALDDYLRALAEAMKNDPERFALDPSRDPDTLVIEGRDLQRMIERLRDMARTGATEAARQMLSQLQNLLENLRGMAQGQNRQGTSEAGRILRDLQDIIGRQEGLLDRTFRQSQQLRRGPWPDALPDTSGSASEQERLRRSLGDVMRRLGEMTGDIPVPLGRAERAMREAYDALTQNAPGRAVGPQGKALEQLREGGRMTADRLTRQFGGLPGQNEGRRGQGMGPRRDPLGRPVDGFGNLDTSDVQIPSQPDLKRARQILDELRRRAGDRRRPPLELDYIDRLLRRF